MEKILFVINDAPYGTEKMFNAMRMSISLLKEHQGEVKVMIFLLGDAVTAMLPDQELPPGYYNIEKMVKTILNNGGVIKACGSCSKARGIEELDLIDDIEISTMSQLSKWTVEADKVLTF
ncbi:MAG: DsrE/DsrF/TusD sulfur relay family protein [Bacillota bacterium]